MKKSTEEPYYSITFKNISWRKLLKGYTPKY